MSNLILEKKWTRWYPKEIFLKDIKNNKKFLFNLDKFMKEDCFTEVNDSIEDDKNKKNRTLELDLIKKEAYKIGFDKGFLKGKKENDLLDNKLNNLFLDFEKALLKFENELCSRLFKIILKISSYVIGKKIDIDKSILVKHIKRIINKDGIFLKKPQLIIHPNNKILIEKTCKYFLNTYKWTLVYDDSIDLNSCKVKSESGDMDSTVDARWQELCRAIYSEEY